MVWSRKNIHVEKPDPGGGEVTMDGSDTNLNGAVAAMKVIALNFRKRRQISRDINRAYRNFKAVK